MSGVRTPQVFRHSILVLLILVVVCSSLLSCSETPTPPSQTPEPTRTVQRQESPSAPATATVAVAATPIVLPPHAPVVVRRFPAPGEELSVDAPIQVTFDQPMDKASVESAFMLEPAVEGKIEWDRNTMTFRPTSRGFTRNASYRVRIGEQAKSQNGLPLQEPVLFRLQTVGYLQVTDVQPAPDATEVDIRPDIVVTFNRPVVPLTAISNQANLPQPLVFDPPVAGKGEWLNTSIYTFRPAEALAPATTYRVAVSAGLTDTIGGAMPEAYRWSFTTKMPAVTKTMPFTNATFVAPTTTITVTFNQPMNQAAAQSAFALLGPNRQAVSGQFSWQGDALIFRPSAPLDLGASYTGRVAAGALAATGGRGTSREFSWNFTVIPAPRIVSTRPANGERQAPPQTQLELTFSSPMERDTLLPNLRIIPEPTRVYTYWGESDTRVWISFGAQPSTSYQVTVGAGLRGRYGHSLDRPATVSFTTGPLDPQISLPGVDRVGIYNAYTETVLSLSHVNVSQADFALYRLSREDFLSLNQEWDLWNRYQPRAEDRIRQWSLALSGALNETVTRRVELAAVEGGALAPGLYYLEVSSPNIQRKGDWRLRQMLVVTRTNLVLKHAERELLVWAADLATGKPVAGVTLTIKAPEGDWLQGATDAQGLYQTPLEAHDMWQPLFCFAERDGAVTAAISQWDGGIQPWQFDLSVGDYTPPYQGLIYTDRAIYRPGQTVYFKGILRTDDDGVYGLPDVETVRVAVHNNEGKELYQKELALNDFGTFNDQLELSPEASLGYYQIGIVPPEGPKGSVFPSAGAAFQVAEYRKPEFLVNVTTERDAYVQGDTIAVSVESSYYFGGAVRDAQVRWRLMSQDYWFQWQGKGWWDFSDLDIDSWRRPPTPFGEIITEGQGRTDSEGHLVFQIPAQITKRMSSQLFTIEATITDVNNQEVSARTGAIVHRGLFYIGLQPEGYVGTAGRAKNVNVITVDTEGITVTNQLLDAIVYEHRWYSVQEKDPDGLLRWMTKAEDIPVLTTTVRTNDQGRGVITFVPPKGGLYRIRARGRDERGNEVSASTYTWISSAEFTAWPRENHDRIELVADQKSYVPGDIAHILIPSPYQGQVTALLTIERGRILEHRLLTLTSNSEQVDIPITSAHVPNIYVSVFLLKGQDEFNAIASFKLGYVALPVSPREKELRISVTPERDTYAPGQTASYAIQATDYGGKGVQAELSLALVDLSVLALSGDQGPDLMERFYHNRPLGVHTASTLAVAAVQQRLAKAAAAEREGKGGDGADQAGQGVRQDFPDTVYWNATLRTDAQGRAQLQVPLADNLTTWRMRADAVTQNTEVGTGKVDILTTKDLLIRPVTPRFFVIGDKAQLAAVVHNNTDREMQATVTLQATGVQVQNSAQQVTVAAHGLTKVVWDTVVQAVEQADLVFSVTGGGLSDAARPTLGMLPVYHYSTPEVIATAGQVGDQEQRIEVVQLPERLDPTQGELTLRLEPSLAAGMRDGLTYLKSYPYDCIEQTVSRFLPNVITYRALKKLGIQNAELEAELPKYITVGLQRIYALQHYDGGWGWWVSDPSHAYLSAYVLLGLNEVEQAGFAVDKDVMTRAAAFLETSLKEPVDVQQGEKNNSRAFVLYVLAEYYRAHQLPGDVSRAVALYERRETLDNYGKAYLALALQLLAPQERTRLDALLSDLTTASIRSATGAHWEEKRVDYGTMNTDLRSTAIILRAFVRIQPEQALIPNVVRWLMAARYEGRWQTTQETSWAIMALTDYLAASGELQADYHYRIGLNGRVWDEGQVTPQNVTEVRTLQVAVGELLRDTGNQLWLERDAVAGQTGQGRLYYSAFLRYFLPAAEVKALNRGIVVSRQYALVEEPTRSLDQIRVGDLIQVKITLIAPNDLHYLVVEDPLPAGCEAVDTSLKTTSAAYQPPKVEPGKGGPVKGAPEVIQAPEARKGPLPYWWYFKHSELRDEKVALFATLLPRGTYEYTYLLRASLPGEFLTMPTQAHEMYFPEVFGRSDGGTFIIRAE